MPTRYESTALVITIATTSPAATHATLMQSIASAMAYCSESRNKNSNYPDEVAPLIDLLKTIMPGEKELAKINA